MKANEFFKKVGIRAVKSYIVAYEDHLTDELKRLVESHELVKSYGGMDQTGFFADMESNDILAARMYKAIADVESCLEADKKLEGL